MLAPGSSYQNILRRMKRLGGPYDVYGTLYGATPVLHIAHPALSRAVLESKRKSPGYDHFKDFCGTGVFTADGVEWKEKRAAVMQTVFNHARLGAVQDLALSEASRLLLQADAVAQSSPDGSLNFLQLTQRMTLSFIYRFLTGKSWESHSSVYLQAVVEVRLVVLAYSRSMWALSRTAYRWLSALWRREKAALRTIHSFAAAAVQDAR
eukprot:gene13134-15506_t